MLDVSINTVKNYISYMENSYLVFTISKYDYSVKKQIYSPMKVYVIDTGLINLVSFKFSRDYGKLLENLVFIELKRRYQDIYYHKGKQECDFIVLENGSITCAIQVTAGLKNNKTREFGGLLEALTMYGLNEGLILTDDEEFEETSEKNQPQKNSPPAELSACYVRKACRSQRSIAFFLCVPLRTLRSLR